MIALNIISEGTKEKQEQLERMLKSIVPFVDGAYITFTQSMEIAPEIEKKYNANISFFQWCDDFAKARNFALDQVPNNYEYIFWCDTDDVVVNATHLKELSGYDAFFMAYNYSIDRTTGEILIQHPRERLVKRDAYRWAGKLHETLIPQRKINAVSIKNIWVNHLPTDEEVKSGFERNERILKKSYDEEKEKDPRTMFYLARTYFDLEKYDEAENLFRKYIVKSGWDEERAQAKNYLGEIALRRNYWNDSVRLFLEAIRERPEFPMFYINLSSAFVAMKEYDKALHFVKIALKMDRPKTAMVELPRDEKIKALEVLFLIMTAKNKYKEALAIVNNQLELFPNDQLFLHRKQFIEKTLELTRQGRVLVDIAKKLDDDKKAALIYSLPDDLAETQFAEKMRHEFLPPIKWGKGTIAYFCGKGFEQWDDTSLEKGVGGSETAVIQLSKQWAKMGYQVVIYGDPKTEHISDGVQYLHYWRWNNKDTFDTIIIWRNESVLNTVLSANSVILDLHDVPEPAEYTKERLAKIDKIYVKSEYHRSLLPAVPDSKFVIVPNGIDITMVPEKTEKEGNQIIWCSSYDRGLEYALLNWNIIKNKVPDAVFHIAYGWNLYDAVHRGNPERQEWKERMTKLMKQDGIVHHGRISQKELIELKAKCKAHYYPSIFEEIDCIGVRESAAVNCVPFTTSYAALKGRKYCITTEGDPFSKETQSAIANKVADYLLGKIQVKEDIAKLAKEESWGNIAKKWKL